MARQQDIVIGGVGDTGWVITWRKWAPRRRGEYGSPWRRVRIPRVAFKTRRMNDDFSITEAKHLRRMLGQAISSAEAFRRESKRQSKKR